MRCYREAYLDVIQISLCDQFEVLLAVLQIVDVDIDDAFLDAAQDLADPDEFVQVDDGKERARVLQYVIFLGGVPTDLDALRVQEQELFFGRRRFRGGVLRIAPVGARELDVLHLLVLSCVGDLQLELRELIVQLDVQVQLFLVVTGTICLLQVNLHFRVIIGLGLLFI